MASEEHHHKGLAIAGVSVLLGAAIIALALFVLPQDGSRPELPPTPPASAATPSSAPDATSGQTAGNAKPTRSPKARAAVHASAGNDVQSARQAWEQAFARNDVAHVPAGWVSGYYDLYGQAQSTFGVNWLLLASVTSPGDGVLDGRKHLSRAQLRALLRGPDAVQRHQRADDDLGALPIRLSPRHATA